MMQARVSQAGSHAVSFFHLSTEEQLHTFLRDNIGLDLQNVNLHQVCHHLMLTERHFSSFEEFAYAVASLIAVHETHFLRHQNQFDWLEQHWLPSWLQHHPDPSHPLRILSAGCSTGEEPYSVYARIKPLLDETGHTLHVDAVDINQHVLNVARSAHYGLWSLRSVDVANESGWLTVRSRFVEVADWVKHGVQFWQHNLTKPLPIDRQYDLILCRNVLLYMHQDAVADTYRHLTRHLANDGLLLPGPCDPNPPDDSGLSVAWHEGNNLLCRHTCQTISLAKTGVTASLARTHATRKPPQPLHNTSAAHTSDYNAIEVMIKTGYYDAARRMLESCLENNAFDVRGYVMLALLTLDLDDVETARDVARKAAFLEPEALFPAYLLATAKQRTGDERGARADCTWLYQRLQQLPEHDAVRYCEEITNGQLKEVLRAGL